MKKTGNIFIGLIATVLVCTALVIVLRPSLKPAAITVNQIKSNLFTGAFLTDMDIIVAGEIGEVYLSSDAGKTWSQVNTPTKYTLLDASFADNKNGWIVGQAGVIIHSADGGRSWKSQDSGTMSTLLGIDSIDSDHACAVGPDSTVLITSDGGRTWTKLPGPGAVATVEGQEPAPGLNLYGIRMIDASTICVGGYMGRLFISRDAGQAWSEVRSPLYDEENQVGRTVFSIGGYPQNMIAAGLDTAMAVSRDSGLTWAEITSGIQEPEIFGVSIEDGTVLAAGSAGAVLVSEDSGAAWNLLEVPEAVKRAWLSDVDLRKTSSGVKGLIVGQFGIIGIYSNKKVSWQIPVIPEVQ